MPHDDRRVLTLVDTHYGGDVSRILLDGIPRVPGASVRDKRDWLQEHGDDLRRLLLYPPYGNPAMCANVIVDADPASDASLGYVIMEAMGYPHFSGSNSICVVTALLEGGHVPMDRPAMGETTVEQDVLLEAPSGPVRARARHDGTHVHAVTVACDPAHVVRRDCVVDLPGRGPVRFDLVWSGCYYAVVEAEDLGLALTEAERPALADLGNDLCLAATSDLDLRHPDHGDTGPLSFVAVAGPLVDDPSSGSRHFRSATYVHPGVVCSCPTGTGTAARLAQLLDREQIGVGDRLTSVSPTGSTMVGHVVGAADPGPGIRVEVTGEAFTLGRTDLVVNRRDPLVDVDGIWAMLASTDVWTPANTAARRG